jgi:hypothetical protein
MRSSPQNRLVHRPRIPVALTLLALFSGTAHAAAAAPTTTPEALRPPNRAVAAAGWTARQMVDGERFETVYDGVTYPDQGLTIDALFAFAATGTAGENAQRAGAWLARPEILTGYTGDGTSEAYAGATAKTTLAAQVLGQDPTLFGGRDLVAQLRGLRSADGRFSDRSAYGDYSNGFTQALAVLALERTAGGAPSATVDYLLSLRCPDGGFPVVIGGTTCTSDVDATALAAQALAAAGRWRAAARSTGWLVSVQRQNGAFTSDGVENANSTGLAAQTLAEAGRRGPAAAARTFLVGLQLGCDAEPGDRGAVPHSASGFEPSTARRSTPQAALGLAGKGFGRLSIAGAYPEAGTLHCPAA